MYVVFIIIIFLFHFIFLYRGTSGIDIDLRRVDIDQCPNPEGEKKLNIFAASDKCKKETTYVSLFSSFLYKCKIRPKDEINDYKITLMTFIARKIHKNSNKSDFVESRKCSQGCSSDDEAKNETYNRVLKALETSPSNERDRTCQRAAIVSSRPTITGLIKGIRTNKIRAYESYIPPPRHFLVPPSYKGGRENARMRWDREAIDTS